jgi:hypothetical protein
MNSACWPTVIGFKGASYLGKFIGPPKSASAKPFNALQLAGQVAEALGWSREK